MARFAAVTQAPNHDFRRKGRNLALNEANGAHGGNSAAVRSRIGQAAPDLRLPDLDGRQISLAAFRGHPTLVLFWNPPCGFCQSMLDVLRAWEANRPAVSPRLLVVSAGSVEANRAMGLRAPVALDAGFNTGRAFGAGGTPSAVLVDSHGRPLCQAVVRHPPLSNH